MHLMHVIVFVTKIGIDMENVKKKRMCKNTQHTELIQKFNVKMPSTSNKLSNFSIKTNVVHIGPQKNHPIEMVLLSSQSTCCNRIHNFTVKNCTYLELCPLLPFI